MSFTDRKPFVVTPEQAIRGFWCGPCGYKFVAGDTARWIYAGGKRFCNFFTCSKCDGPNEQLIERAKESYTMAVKMAKQWDIYGPDWEKRCR